MPLNFSEILAEALFSEVVPLGHFRRVAVSSPTSSREEI